MKPTKAFYALTDFTVLVPIKIDAETIQYNVNFSQYFFQFYQFFFASYLLKFWNLKRKTESIVQILGGYFMIMKHYPPHPCISADISTLSVFHGTDTDSYFVILTCASCDSSGFHSSDIDILVFFLSFLINV